MPIIIMPAKGETGLLPVKVVKVKNGRETVLEVNGLRYALDVKDLERKGR